MLIIRLSRMRRGSICTPILEELSFGDLPPMKNSLSAKSTTKNLELLLSKIGICLEWKYSSFLLVASILSSPLFKESKGLWLIIISLSLIVYLCNGCHSFYLISNLNNYLILFKTNSETLLPSHHQILTKSPVLIQRLTSKTVSIANKVTSYYSHYTQNLPKNQTQPHYS